MFIDDIFLFIEKPDIWNFDDDIRLFSGGDNLSVSVKRLERDMKFFYDSSS